MATQVAVNTKVEESIAFSRGRQSLDRSVWYSGSLFTFLATGKETQGQFALIESVARKGNAPPRHIHQREDETFYVLEGEITVSVGVEPLRPRPEQWCFCHATWLTLSRSSQNICACSYCSRPLVWRNGSRNSAFQHQP